MDVVVIFNGLGNQMSQYAFYCAKKKLSPTTRFIFDKRSSHTHDGFALNRAFNIGYKQTFLSKMLYLLFRILVIEKCRIISGPLIGVLRIFGIYLVKEQENYDFDPFLLNSSSHGIRFLYGGWHSEKYFVEIKEELKNVFHAEYSIGSQMQALVDRIRFENIVSLHIRRGDYMIGDNLRMWGTVCSLDYFREGIKFFESTTNDPLFLVFSNDLAWAKSSFIGSRFIFIEAYEGQTAWTDLFLISLCRHHINSNSTFSWWGAWLTETRETITVRPQFFINNFETEDIYPSRWIKI